MRPRLRRWPRSSRSAAGPAADEVTEAVVAIVAELTGYPPELLDLDLDLEADLGVDTVKQAEVFAAVRERFGVERDDTLPLRDFPTLTHVIGWVRERTGHLEPSRPVRRVVGPGERPMAVAPVPVHPATVLGDLRGRPGPGGRPFRCCARRSAVRPHRYQAGPRYPRRGDA